MSPDNGGSSPTLEEMPAIATTGTTHMGSGVGRLSFREDVPANAERLRKEIAELRAEVERLRRALYPWEFPGNSRSPSG